MREGDLASKQRGGALWGERRIAGNEDTGRPGESAAGTQGARG